MIDPVRPTAPRLIRAAVLVTAALALAPLPGLAQSPPPKVTFPAKVPLPPPRPASLGGSKGPVVVAPPPAASTTAPALKPAMPAAPGPSQITPQMTNREIIERVNAALNAVPFMSADFTQVGADRKSVV